MAKRKQLENLLDSIELSLFILKKGLGYYVYYNKPNKNSKRFKIHFSSCGECAWGTGKINGAKPGLNGVWIGPFSEIYQAQQFTTENFNINPSQVEVCNCCK